MSGIRPNPEVLLDEPLRDPLAERVGPSRDLRAVSANTRMMHVSLHELLARKSWVFAAMIVAFCVSSIVYWNTPPLYSSMVSFYVLEPPVHEKDQPLYLSLGADAVVLRHIATSTAMFDHLIDTYGLPVHYGIPEGKANERALLYKTLERRVVVDQRESDIIEVVVKDADRSMAAALANGVFSACDSMLRAEQQAQVRGQLKIIDQVIDTTEHAAMDRSTELIRLSAIQDPSGQRSQETQLALLTAANDVADINYQLVAERRNRANLLAMISDPQTGPVRLKSRATEDLGPSTFYQSVQWIITITLAAGVVAAALILLIIETWWIPPAVVPHRR